MSAPPKNNSCIRPCKRDHPAALYVSLFLAIDPLKKEADNERQRRRVGFILLWIGGLRDELRGQKGAAI